MSMLATAKAKLTIEINSLGSWSSDCRIDQITSQASEAALGVIRKMQEKVNHQIQVVGEPVITTVVIMEEK